MIFAAMMLVIRYISDAENYSGDDLDHRPAESARPGDRRSTIAEDLHL